VNEKDKLLNDFKEALKDEGKRKALIDSFTVEGLKRDVLEFEKVTGYSISKFLLFLTTDEIRIDDSKSNMTFVCPQCNTKHKLFIEKKEVIPSKVDSSKVSYEKSMYTNINCLLCGLTVSIPGNLKKVEVCI
jgi:transcription elongation factor Elf1